MLEKVKEPVQMPSAFLEYYVDGPENSKHTVKQLNFSEQLIGFSKTIDRHHVCQNHDNEQLKPVLDKCLKDPKHLLDNSIPKDVLFSALAQELLATPLMSNLRTWAWTNLELQIKSQGKANANVQAIESEWSQQRAHFPKLNPLLMLKAWGYFKQGQVQFNLEGEILSHQIEKEILSTFKLSQSHTWLSEFIAYVKERYILAKLTRELVALSYDQMVSQVLPLLATQFRQILRQEKLGTKPLLLIYPHGKSGIMLLVINKHGEMIDDSMIYPFAPDYDEEQALVHFSKLMMRYPNEHVVWMIKPETRKAIQTLVDKFRQRYPDLPWTLHGLPNSLSQILVKTKTPQTEDVAKIGHFAQNPAEILANINCLDLIPPLFKHLPHAKIQSLWTRLLQEYLLFSGLDIQQASPALLKASQLFTPEDIKKIIDSRASNPIESKTSLQQLLGQDTEEFRSIAAFVRITHSTNALDNSFFLNEDQAYLESVCQALGLQGISELLDYPAFKLKEPCHRFKKLLQVYQQFKKNAAIYDKKAYLDLEQIPKHQPFFGSVTKIMPYGAFIDLGHGLEGLLHHSTLIHGMAPDLKLILNEGDTIKVEWLNYDANQKRLSLKYHGDYFITKTETFKKSPIKPQKEQVNKDIQKTTANKQHKDNTPTAMALAFAKLKASPTDHQ
ncbi:MAG: S1 RNA-binding domain-containing protein [Gammaproteobacteria bacterium]|nr:S1 RNA-binding domain-containing protein [Gammaproteobacteria bacterium]